MQMGLAIVTTVGLAATAVWFAVFCALLSDGQKERRPIFATGAPDQVGHTLIRSVQAAFILGYGAWAIFSLVEAGGRI